MFEEDKRRYEIRLYDETGDNYHTIAYGDSKPCMENCLGRMLDHLEAVDKYCRLCLVDKSDNEEETLWDYDISIN